MSDLLLATKLSVPPPHPQLVSRPRLISHLNQAVDHQLTLVSAPAGFGKTVLAERWIDRLPPEHAIAWLSLDDGDGDPVRFWSYLVEAVRRIGETGKGRLAGSVPSTRSARTRPMTSDMATPRPL